MNVNKSKPISIICKLLGFLFAFVAFLLLLVAIYGWNRVDVQNADGVETRFNTDTDLPYSGQDCLLQAGPGGMLDMIKPKSDGANDYSHNVRCFGLFQDGNGHLYACVMQIYAATDPFAGIDEENVTPVLREGYYTVKDTQSLTQKQRDIYQAALDALNARRTGDEPKITDSGMTLVYLGDTEEAYVRNRSGIRNHHFRIGIVIFLILAVLPAALFFFLSRRFRKQTG